jgi:hypothetical protein
MLSKRRVVCAVFAGLALAACGGSAFSADDASPGPGRDSGTSPDGSGTPPMDATTPPVDGTAPGPDGTTANDTGTPSNETGAPDAAGPIPCPATQPTAQTPCTPGGRVCEYGSSPVEECDTLATCTSGAWSISMPDTSGKDCPSHLDLQNCPATEDGVSKGGVCTQAGLICDYTRGRCDCESGGSGVVVVVLDGGSITPTWRCQQPSTGCPDGRPNLGTACTTEGMSCDYGSCGEIIGGSAEICRGGIWQAESVPCPQ